MPRPLVGPESYIVRIYRREIDAVAGIVEETRSRRTRPFRSLEELAELLRHPVRAPRRRAGHPATEPKPLGGDS